MLERSTRFQQKNIMIINDVPVKIEIECGESYSSASNTNLLTSLRTGRVNPHNKIPVSGFKSISQRDLHCNYLDFTYYGEPDIEHNYDYFQEVVNSKQISANMGKFLHKETGDEFIKLQTHKDIFVSLRLWKEFKKLLNEIQEVKPKLILITGKWGLFFLTGKSSLAETQGNGRDRKPLGALTTYRSSIMEIHEVYKSSYNNFGLNLQENIIIPIYHPQHYFVMPDKVAIMDLDIQKIGHMYSEIKEKGVKYYLTDEDKNIILGTDKTLILEFLSKIKEKLDKQPVLMSVDIETMFMSIIDCVGIAISKDEGICIPFASVGNSSIWSIEDEIEIMVAMREILEHPNALHLGQNYSYDCQFFYRRYCINVKPKEDSLILHYILYNYLPRNLAFLASLYCEKYRYWKDEVEATKETPETRWKYNVKDILYTIEIQEILLQVLQAESENDPRILDLYRWTIDEFHPEVTATLNRGVRVDKEQKESLYIFFSDIIEKIRSEINKILGFDFNPNSTPQKKKLFKDYFGIELKLKRNKGRESTETMDAAAMKEYVEEYPILSPFLTLLLELNAVKTFTRTFLAMELDEDDRARTQYKIAGTKTGRLASVKNVWGKGGNLANLPASGKLPLHYVLEVLKNEIPRELRDEQGFDSAIEEWNEYLNQIIEQEESEYESESL